ncbi:hypothetical protein [Paractinoplanes abujensis]|uniref:Uncharacterized protein n=1 Tax=Paractinoplanes abujensis TaxID=882441 RepID=A0A7W7CYU7_9ACTN|nr:hypothetical protein [Actinoplanes abujensis]MBB4696020.1 hypothetical protein [Actinoplanes abujensis]
MATIRWADVEEWFDPSQNGSAPDVVVPDTAIADWEALLALIRSEGWRCEYALGEERRPLPPSAAELFEPDPEGRGRSLWVWPDPGLEWIVRLWTPDEVVSDVSLHEIQGQKKLDAFCRFLCTLGAALGKSVLMYAEGSHDYPPMMAYQVADDRVVFLAGSWR